jgi:multicomponent Na+:H+ antiporter subunit F
VVGLRTAVELLLLLSMLAGLVRAVRGPTLADRITVAQLFGTTSVAVLLLHAADGGRDGLRDVAVIFAPLSTITVAAFVSLAPFRRSGPRNRS